MAKHNQDRGTNFQDNSLRIEINDIRASLKDIDDSVDALKEKLISLNAEYINDKTWIHNTLRSTMDSLDKTLDRLSRLEGKMDNGINKSVVDLKESVGSIQTQLRNLMSKEEGEKMESRLQDKIVSDKDSLIHQYEGLSDNVKEDKKDRHKNAIFIISIIGQVLTLIGVIIAIIRLA